MPIPPERARDPWEQNEPGRGRDPARTPMQWDSSPNAGFSSAEPWLPLDPHAANCNVETLRDDPGSILTLYRRLLGLRREHAALSLGAYRAVSVENDVFVYEREHADEVLRILLNFGHAACSVPLPAGSGWRVLLSSSGSRIGERPADGHLALAGDEALVLLRERPASDSAQLHLG